MAISSKFIQDLARINGAKVDLSDANAVKDWFDNSSYKYMADASADNRSFVERIITALLLLGDETDNAVGLTMEERNSVMRIADDASLIGNGSYLTEILRLFSKKAGDRDLARPDAELNMGFVQSHLHNYGFDDRAVETIVKRGNISAKVKLVDSASRVMRTNASTKTIIAKTNDIDDVKAEVIDLAKDVYKNSGARPAYSIKGIPNRIWTDSDVTIVEDADDRKVIAKSNGIKSAEERIMAGTSHPLTGVLKHLVDGRARADVQTPDQIIDDIQAYLLMNDRLTTVKKEDEWNAIRKEIAVDARLAVDKDDNVSLYTPARGEELSTKDDIKKIVNITELGSVGIEAGASFVGYDISDPDVREAYELMQQGLLRANNRNDKLAINLLNAHKLYSSAVGLPVSPKTTTANIYANMVDDPEGIIGKDGLTSDMRNFFRKIANNPNSPYYQIEIDNGVAEQRSDKKMGLEINYIFKNKTKKLVKTKLQFSTRFIGYDDEGKPSLLLKSDDAIKFSVIQSMVLDYVSNFKEKVNNVDFKIVGAEKDKVRDPNERALMANLATQFVMTGYSFGDSPAHKINEELISTYLMENQATILAGLAKSGKDYAVVLPRAYKWAMRVAEIVTDSLGIDKTMKRDSKTGRITGKSELVANFERHGFTFPRMNSNDQPLFLSNEQKARLSGADLKKYNAEEKRLHELGITSQDSLGALLISCIDTQLSPKEITFEPQNQTVKQADENKFEDTRARLANKHDALPVIDPSVILTDDDLTEDTGLDATDVEEIEESLEAGKTKTPTEPKHTPTPKSVEPKPVEAEKKETSETAPKTSPEDKKKPRSLFDMMTDRIKKGMDKKDKAVQPKEKTEVGYFWDEHKDAGPMERHYEERSLEEMESGNLPVRTKRTYDDVEFSDNTTSAENRPEVIYLPGKVEEVSAEELTEEDKDAVITGKQAFKDRMKQGKLEALFKEKDEKTPTKEAIYGYIDGKFYFAIRHIKTGKVTDRFETELSKTTKTKIDKAQGEEKDALIAKYAEKAAKAYKQFKNAKRDTKIEK